MQRHLDHPARVSTFIGVFLCATFVIAVASSPAADYVIHISIDGLNAAIMQEVIDAGDAPTLRRLEQEGAWTPNARTDYTYTVTLPNHTSMLTGLPVEQPAGMPNTACHGWTRNDVPPHGATLHNSGNPHRHYIASVFDVVHDAGLSTALYVSKDKFVIYDQSYDETSGAADAHGRDKIDCFYFQDDGPPTYSAGMNQRFLDDLKQHHFRYSFVHYRDTDSAGHAFGWGSGEYKRVLTAIDGYLADVLEVVETDPMLKDRTAIVITTDHGGIGTNHYEVELPENYTIPVFVWGAGVGRGDLYAMNRATRSDPGDARPDYCVEKQPIRNGGTGNLALGLLGLDPMPGSVINREQDVLVTFMEDAEAAPQPK